MNVQGGTGEARCRARATGGRVVPGCGAPIDGQFVLDGELQRAARRSRAVRPSAVMSVRRTLASVGCGRVADERGYPRRIRASRVDGAGRRNDRCPFDTVHVGPGTTGTWRLAGAKSEGGAGPGLRRLSRREQPQPREKSGIAYAD